MIRNFNEIVLSWIRPLVQARYNFFRSFPVRNIKNDHSIIHITTTQPTELNWNCHALTDISRQRWSAKPQNFFADKCVSRNATMQLVHNALSSILLFNLCNVLSPYVVEEVLKLHFPKRIQVGRIFCGNSCKSPWQRNLTFRPEQSRKNNICCLVNPF